MLVSVTEDTPIATVASLFLFRDKLDQIAPNRSEDDGVLRDLRTVNRITIHAIDLHFVQLLVFRRFPSVPIGTALKLGPGELAGRFLLLFLSSTVLLD